MKQQKIADRERKQQRVSEYWFGLAFRWFGIQVMTTYIEQNRKEQNRIEQNNVYFPQSSISTFIWRKMLATHQISHFYHNIYSDRVDTSSDSEFFICRFIFQTSTESVSLSLTRLIRDNLIFCTTIALKCCVSLKSNLKLKCIFETDARLILCLLILTF